MELVDIPVDPITSLLLFLFGAPVLVFQLVSSDVREVITRRHRVFLYSSIAPGFLGAVIVLIAYIVSQTVSEAVLPKFFWPGVLGSLVVLAGVVTVMIFRMGKQGLIRWIIARAIRRRRSIGEYSQAELTDLELLGQESKGGEEKGWVISALGTLADNVLTSSQYSGGQLEGLMTTLSVVLLEGAGRGTPENFRSSIELLRRVVRTHYQQAAFQPDFVDADLAHAIRTLSLLARQALVFPQQGITATCLAILSDHATAINPANSAISQALREIGTEAIARDQLSLALEALTPLDVVVFAEGNAPLNDELLYDFLGLLSALWKHGASGEEKAGEYLADLAAKPGLVMEDLLWRTVYHHRRTNRFAVADRVIEMYRQWSKQQPDLTALPARIREPSG